MPDPISTRRPPISPSSPLNPSSPSNLPSSATPAASAPRTSGPTAPPALEPNPAVSRLLGHPTTGTPQAASLQTLFAPYDDTRKQEIALLDEIIAARKADPKTYPGENPYQIRYAVYNISSEDILKKLVEADRAGIAVQILIEDDQLSPDKPWNDADEFLRSQGFSFAADHKRLSPEERRLTQLIGIKNDTLMHLKSRIFEYPDPHSGEPVKKLLTGSMNPGQSAVSNDENLNLVTDPAVVETYITFYEAVRDQKSFRNSFDPNAAINPMFTGKPVTSGPRVTDQIFRWIDQEKEAIFLSVFTLRNLTTPSERASLVDKLKAAKDRGVEVVVITDQKQSDGVDAQGQRVFSDDPTDDLLRKAGIPVYEALNTSGPFNAMHAKTAIFGLSEMKVITDTGNWTAAALGSAKSNRAQNEESYLFIDSQKLDENATGKRYLGNFLHLLRTYAPQNPSETDAETLIQRLAQNPAWPRVTVDFSVMAHTFMGQDVYVTGDHPALGSWLKEGPGMKLHTQPGRYPFWESGGSLDLPFGAKFEYKVVTKNPDGSVIWPEGKNHFLIVDPMDSRFSSSNDPSRLLRRSGESNP